MKLKDVELLPGTVINVNDELKVGRIKAFVPTLFDTTLGMDAEGLPWIYPLIMPGQQYFSKLVLGSKVWVLKNTESYNEFWYIPMVEYTSDSSHIIDDYNNAELLISRQAGENSVYVYYNDGEGFNIKVGPNSFVKIGTDSKITLSSAGANIVINNSKIYLGGNDAGECTEDPSSSAADNAGCEPVVLGNRLKHLLEDLNKDLSKLIGVANQWTTQHLLTELTSLQTHLKDNTEKLTSNTVHVSK